MTIGKFTLENKNCDCEVEIQLILSESTDFSLKFDLSKISKLIKMCTMHEMMLRNNLLKEARKEGMGERFEMLRNHLSDLSNEVH